MARTSLQTSHARQTRLEAREERDERREAQEESRDGRQVAREQVGEARIEAREGAAKQRGEDVADQRGNGIGQIAKEFQDADQFYFVNFTELNQSGVQGGALLGVNENGTPDDVSDDTLSVYIAATGLEPGIVHPQHIHGEDGKESVTPPQSADTDGDGFVELAEGLPFYHGILLNLTSPQGSGLSGFPTAPDGSISFFETYHLHSEPSVVADGGHAAGDVIDDFSDLDEYEIVLHGMTVPAVGDGTPGEVDGTAGYKAVLPVASGEIQELDGMNGLSALAHLRNAFDGHGKDGDWLV